MSFSFSRFHPFSNVFSEQKSNNMYTYAFLKAVIVYLEDTLIFLDIFQFPYKYLYLFATRLLRVLTLILCKRQFI